jgi:V-type H+-transporting ATPase subunit G
MCQPDINIRFQQHTKGNKAAEDEANREADEKIEEIKNAGKEHQAKVIDELLKAVLEVKLASPAAA